MIIIEPYKENKMTITAILKPFVTINGLIHNNTTWEISTNVAFTNKISTEKNVKWLNIYLKEIEIPVGTTYYVRAKRHFNNAALDAYTTPIPVKNEVEASSTMLLDTTKIIAEQPVVYVNEAELTNTNTDMTIKTSKPRITNDGHISTHWIIRDGNGDVLFRKLNDTVNKTSLTINKTDAGIRNKTKLEFIAIHCASGSHESPIGSTMVSIGAQKYEVNVITDNVTPYTDLTVKLTSIPSNTSMSVVACTLVNSVTDEVLYNINTDPIASSLNVVIPWEVLTPTSTFKLRITSKDEMGDIDTNELIINTSTGANIDEMLPALTYSKTIARTANYSTPSDIEDNITTIQLPNKKILLPIGNKLYYFLFNEETGTLTKDVVADGISMLASTNDETYIKLLDNNMLLVDTVSSSNKPTFMVYAYNEHSEYFTLLKSSTRTNETHPVGYNNSIVQISLSEFIYMPYGSSKLMKYDITTNTVTTLVDTGLAAVTNNILIKMHDNRIMVFGGNNVYTTKIYNISDNMLYDGISMPGNTFVNRKLKTVQLANGDTLVRKADDLSGDNETDYLYFEYTESKFSNLTLTSTNALYPKTTVALRTGKILMLNTYTTYVTTQVFK